MPVMADFVWGKKPTEFFFKITPDRVLEAVERSGLQCTGRCLALGSFENRVYDVELEVEGAHLSERSRVIKFYRPGRWTLEQILEEHEFLLELVDQEIPVVPPLKFPDGKTLHQDPESQIYYTLFPKVGGRAPDELGDEHLQRLGRLLARIHNVGAAHPSKHRISLNHHTYGEENLKFLLQSDEIPLELKSRYEKAAQRIIQRSAPLFDSVAVQRIHGDCHMGNLLWNDQGPFFLDFDDMVMGPPIQDFWLLVAGRDITGLSKLDVLIQAYEQMREFDHTSLKLIEPLRALRMIHFSSWIAKRWEDPAFPNAFPQFKTQRYWEEQTQDLESIQFLG